MTDPRARVDGRRLRAVRTRATIVEALYELVREGHATPTAAEIAARAGVALRSIGQHFASREALLAAVAEHHAAQAPPRTAIPTTGPLADRIAAFAQVRAADLERTAPLRRAIAAMRAPSSAVAEQQRRARDRRRAELAAAFAPELAAAPDRARLLDRLYLVTSGPAWDTLRTHLALSRRASLSEIRTLLTALLR